MVWQPHQLLRNSRLPEEHSISLLYHDIFGFPMRENELARWRAGVGLRLIRPRPRVETQEGFYYLKGREVASERIAREAVSKRKMKVLANARHIFEDQKDILMVGITGSLAMASAKETSDIDLMVVTKKERLWSTRAKTLLSLLRNGVAIRRAKEPKEEDRLCLNIWMDETDLVIASPRNAYTAHELAQVTPLINRDATYEKLISANGWILDYWPSAVQTRISNFETENYSLSFKNVLGFLIEKVAFGLQRLYMRRKVTREVITPTRAFFHPFDWSRKVKIELERRGVLDKEPKSF